LQHGGVDKARLIWLHDVAEVIQCYRDRLKWDEMVDRAQAYRLTLPVLAALSWASEVEGAPVPARALERLCAWQPSRQERRVYDLRTGPDHWPQRTWANLVSIGGWRQRLHYVGCLLFPSPAYLAQRYGPCHRFLVPLSHVRRWLDSFRRLFS